MKARKPKSFVKQCTGIALASLIGCSGLGVFATSVNAAENTNQVTMNPSLQAENMTITQLQNAIQHKDDSFIIHVKIFIDKHKEESEVLWGKVSSSLKKDIVNILTGEKKDYSTKINRALVRHFREVPSLLKLATPEFKKEIIQLLKYL
ncbi:hypothetical protein BTT_61830 (plasmid) [Bacillus thuringiensis serovar morrisoni str. 4AA1]|uniref:hypothetical protein n=1 Tax=Bacillus TaxID=1386 RepID=UPI0005CF5E7C|nr:MULTISPECIES: hypothetical protein [Bacillus]AJQ62524.1 hypothetical protein SD98_30150 [Bacillus thuringiensis serovar morrisoni]MED3102529.1 hypothetical protein [Bacillus thuringiensis]MRB00049.1 hypothetical protein [Bacillus thuringiensis]OTY30569.1 hypothetical protein BK736_26575 [Bacillus thuringiensis serovar poloniensis]RUR58695.1 hypothetical protein ELS81_30865 [Bacillus sp. VKPM B-3276]